MDSLPSLVSYFFNPMDKNSNAYKNFHTLSIERKIAVIAFTALCTIASVGIASLAAFRFITGKLSPTDEKTKEVAQPLLHPGTGEKESRGVTKESSKEFPPSSEKESKEPPRKISEATETARTSLTQYLERENIGTLGQAVDNGDCFYHSVAQLLSQRLKKEISTKDVRTSISEYVQQLEEEEGPNNWIARKKKDEYGVYKELVQYTYDELLEKNRERDVQKRKIENQIKEEQDKLARLKTQEDADDPTSMTRMFINVAEARIKFLEKNFPPNLYPTWGTDGIDDKIVAECFNISVQTFPYDKVLGVSEGLLQGKSQSPPLLLAYYRNHYVPIIPSPGGKP